MSEIEADSVPSVEGTCEEVPLPKVDAIRMRRNPTWCDLSPAFRGNLTADDLMGRASRISRIYNLIRGLAAASGIEIRQIDRSDFESSIPPRFSHLVPLAAPRYDSRVPKFEYSDLKREPIFPIVISRLDSLSNQHDEVIKDSVQWKDWVKWINSLAEYYWEAGIMFYKPGPPPDRLLKILYGDLDHFDDLSALAHTLPHLKVPKFVKYSQQKDAPTFPIVAKNLAESHGSAKYLIETPDQWATFVKWVDDHYLELEVENFWIFQEFVESPVGRPTSLRVLVDCLGNVMASQLLYGPPFSDGFKVRKVDRPDSYKDDLEVLLEDPDSPYFLNARSIASNKRFAAKVIDVPRANFFADAKGSPWEVAEIYRDPKTQKRVFKHTDRSQAEIKATVFTEIMGRITIGFDRGDFVPNDIERELLSAHGFDPEDPRLPKELVDQAKLIARRLSIKNGEVHALYLGLDFIRGKDGNWYFLEANRRPSLTAVKEAELLPDADNVLEFVVRRIMERIASLKK